MMKGIRLFQIQETICAGTRHGRSWCIPGIGSSVLEKRVWDREKIEDVT